MFFSDSYFAWLELFASNHLFQSGSVIGDFCGNTAVPRSETDTDLLVGGGR